ncbi:MAG: phenylalanine--tRNA ligase subunit beta [Candidatus Methanophagaceae archaeon]|nr:MAG: phenylalanine--tRNA ligase subunit beta [Methanophagales archaeon]
MPVIRLPYSDLESLTGTSIERIKEQMPLMPADVERVESEYMDVEFFPNRPDLFSVEGVARALRQFLEVEPGLVHYEVEKSGIEMVVDPSVGAVRPYIACGVAKGVHLNSNAIESLMQLQEHLHRGIGRNRAKIAIGLHDLKKVKPPFKYLAVEPGFAFIPLDYEEEMSLSEILARHPKGVAYGHILKGRAKYPLILDSTGNTLSFPPIINAELTRVTESTTDLFIDVTGMDMNVTIALNIVASALVERGGRIQSVLIHYPDGDKETPHLEPKKMVISMDDVNSLIGIELGEQECKRCCERMGLDAKVVPGGKIELMIPAYRYDIIHTRDIIEDIAIGYGYNRIKPENPTTSGSVIGEEHPVEERKSIIREIMTGLGYFEVITFILTSARKQFELMQRAEDEESGAVKVASPISSEYTMLRCSILPNLLEILASNKHRDMPQRIFEVGPVISAKDFEEREHLASLSIHATANFAEVKSVVDAVLKELGYDYGDGDGGVESKVEVVESADDAFLAGRRADIIINSEKRGVFGEIHPQVLLNFGLDYPVVGFELDVS